MKSEHLNEPELAGREAELQELEEIFELVSQGRGATVFVSGEAGVGKTRLIKEFLQKTKQKGITVLSGWCLSDAAVPYFPFVEALKGLDNVSEDDQPFEFGDSGNFGSITATPPLGPEPHGIGGWPNLIKLGTKEGIGNLSPQVWKDQLFAGIAGFLHGTSAQTPVILFIEDLHWADSASLALFHYLSRAVKGSEQVLLIATYRTEGLTADSEGHMHPLLEEIRLMRREDLFIEVELKTLSTQNIRIIAESMLGGQIEESLIEKLKQESHGNSLFIVESIRMLKERQRIFQDQGKWRLTIDAIGIPSKIKDIILQRIALLKFNQKRVLDAASVIGEKFKVELLERCSKSRHARSLRNAKYDNAIYLFTACRRRMLPI